MVNVQLQQQLVQGAGGKAAMGNDAAIITTESLTTAAGATLTYTILSPQITHASVLAINLYNGSNSQGTPVIAEITPSDNGSATVLIQNIHGTLALNGSLKMNVVIFN